MYKWVGLKYFSHLSENYFREFIYWIFIDLKFTAVVFERGWFRPPPPHWMQKKKRATIDSSKSLFNPINIPNVQLRFSLALWKCTLEEGNDFVHVRSSASGTIVIVKRGCFEFKNWDEVYNCSFLFQFFYIQNFQLRYVSSVRNDETLPN